MYMYYNEPEADFVPFEDYDGSYQQWLDEKEQAEQEEFDTNSMEADRKWFANEELTSDDIFFIKYNMFANANKEKEYFMMEDSHLKKGYRPFLVTDIEPLPVELVNKILKTNREYVKQFEEVEGIPF